MSLNAVAGVLVVPPLSLLVLGLLGLGLTTRRRWRRVAPLGTSIMAIALIGLTVLSLPVVADALTWSLERDLPLLPPGAAPPAAIVILGGDSQGRAGDPPTYDVGGLTLERLRTGAALARQTGLPLLVTGGHVPDQAPPIADLMARSLDADFGAPARWRETESPDTWGNAMLSAPILRASGIGSVYLVTHGWHMRRAVMAFRRAGLTVTAAPTWLDPRPRVAPTDFIPRARSWLSSYYALHEWIGCAVYALR